jgi:hypothetical protein
MSNMEVFFGSISLLSFLFALYQYFSVRSKGSIEEAKTRMQLERIRHAKFGIVAAAETVDLIVQRSKTDSTQYEELRSLARVSRGQLVLIIKELNSEVEKLENWKYGKLFQSEQYMEQEVSEISKEKQT